MAADKIFAHIAIVASVCQKFEMLGPT